MKNKIKNNIEKVKKFNWWRIILPFTTYYRLKNNGIIHPVTILLDIVILLIPFSTIFVVWLVNSWLNDIE